MTEKEIIIFLAGYGCLMVLSVAILTMLVGVQGATAGIIESYNNLMK